MTALAFLALFVTLSVMAFVRHPVYGLYLYVAVFYLHPPSRWWAASLPDLRWSLLAAAITCIAIWVQNKKAPTTRNDRLWIKGPALWFLLYVLYMYMQSPWAVYPEEHHLALSIFTKYLVVIYMIHECVGTREHLAGFLLTHGLGCLYLGLVAWTIGGGGRLDGVGGPGIDDANTLAMQLATGVYAAAAFYFSEQSRWRFLALLIVPFALNGLIMSGSRGGFLALTAGGLAFFLLRPANTLRQIAVYGAAGLILFAYTASDFFLERMTTIATAVEDPEEVDGSIATRLVLFGAQWEMAKAYPLGAGHAATTALSYRYIPIEHHSSKGGRSSHNTFMSALVDQGFLGLAVWVTIAVMIWMRLRNARKTTNKHHDAPTGWLISGAGAMLIAILVAGLFAPLIRQEIYVWTLALSCCIPRILSAREERISRAAQQTQSPQPTDTAHTRATPTRPRASEAIRTNTLR